MTFIFEKERMTARSTDGVLMGSVIFPRIRAGLVNISDISVVPAFRNQGVKSAMMDALLVRLSELGLKAALTCPFAQQYVEQNPHWKKILPGEIHFTRH